MLGLCPHAQRCSAPIESRFMTQLSPRDRVAFSDRPASSTSRFVVALALLALAFILLVAIIARPGMDLDAVIAERHVRVEAIQAWLWVIIAAVAALGCLRQTRRRGLLLLCWLAIAAVLGGLRELDLHVVLNPENIHLLGLKEEQAVHFGTRWWFGSETPMGLRLSWGLVFLLAGALALGPFILARYPWPRQLRCGARFPWLVTLGFLLLLCGFLIDDVGRPLRKAGVKLSLAEEVIELVGQLLLFASVVLLTLRKVDLVLPAGESGD